MKLRNYLGHYVTEHDLAPASIDNYRTTVRIFDAWNKGPVKMNRLNDNIVNSFLEDYLQRPVSRHTVKTRRTILLMLLKSAFESGRSRYQPQRIKPIRCSRPDVDTWSLEEMQRLLDACSCLGGTFAKTDLSRERYFRALFAVAWDTALRRGDLLALESEQLLEPGKFKVIQAKTQSAKLCEINDDTRELFRETLIGPRPLAFPLWASVDQLVRLAKRVMHRAGLDSNRHHIFHKIRRSSITHLESIASGCGWIHGGHSDPSIAARHYIDRNEAYKDLPIPQSLQKPAA